MLALALRDNAAATIVRENTAGMLFGKDGAELTGGQTIIFRSEPTVLSPAGHDYSVSGIPPDLRVRDERSEEHDAILVHALEPRFPRQRCRICGSCGGDIYGLTAPNHWNPVD